MWDTVVRVWRVPSQCDAFRLQRICIHYFEKLKSNELLCAGVRSELELTAESRVISYFFLSTAIVVRTINDDDNGIYTRLNTSYYIAEDDGLIRLQNEFVSQRRTVFNACNNNIISLCSRCAFRNGRSRRQMILYVARDRRARRKKNISTKSHL